MMAMLIITWVSSIGISIVLIRCGEFGYAKKTEQKDYNGDFEEMSSLM
jgi:hypothetical protein